MVVGAILRLYNLPLVPFHHDEGVNGNFLVHLVRDGRYVYDPENYHGPSLYYFSAIIPWIVKFLFGVSAQNTYGLTSTNVRLVTALFGLGTIWLILLLRSRLGSVGSLAGAALLAISPGAVYLSRYFIHESLFVFFTLGIVVAFVKYYDDGHPIYMVLGACSAALLFTTKETWIISVGVLLIALVLTHIYRRFWLAVGLAGKDRFKLDSFADWKRKTMERLGGPARVALAAVFCCAVAIAIGVLFYSSFFTNWKGVSDSLKTFAVWSKTGTQAHVHPLFTYFGWLQQQEIGLLVLGVLGAVAIVLKPRNSLALFCALWAFGILAAYSLIPYKTPWLCLNFIVPLSLISGYAFQAFYEMSGRELTRPLILGAGIAVCVAGYQSLVLNFSKYDDDQYTYVYAHSRREMLDLIAEVDKVAKNSGTGPDTGITIVSPEYWPLPWYFRDYKRVGYYGKVSMTSEPIIIASETQRADIENTYGDRYREINSKFPLRPGVDLLLFVRKDVAGP
jgi:uncharacterized protein (TIGR03663 family)